MPDMFDLVVLGGGPAGYVGAIRAAQLGMRVGLVEEDKLGGVCLNIGCIPSKALIHQAELMRSIPGLQKLGVKVDVSGLDYAAAHKASRTAADSLSKGVQYLLKKNKVTVHAGRGVLAGAGKIAVGGDTLTAKNVLLATGSRPRSIPGFEFDEAQVLSSNGALMLTTLPKSLLILGGGAIGMEFAHVMSAFGVRVHVVEMMPSILPLEEPEAAEVVRKSMVKRGVTISTATRALTLERQSGACRTTVAGADGAESVVETEMILVVVGRQPNTENLGLDTVGVSTERGFVPVGDYYETTTRGLYAAGDIVASPMLAHVASKEAEIAVEHMAGHVTKPRIDPTCIPSAVYCEPQIAGFGLSEQKAKEQGLDARSASFPYRGAGKSVAIGHTEGMVKVVYEATRHEILGAYVVGAEATELVHELLLARTAELLPEDIATMIHAHPTLSEAVMEAMRAVEGWAIHA